MKLTVFAKNVQKKDGKTFTKFLTRLTRKDGTEETVEVKFTQATKTLTANDCPCIINATHCNLAKQSGTNAESGVAWESKKLWVSAWETTNEVYRDTSLDDYLQ